LFLIIDKFTPKCFLYTRCLNCPEPKEEDEEIDEDEVSYIYDNEENEYKEKRDSSKV
jgi:hypothetical protein